MSGPAPKPASQRRRRNPPAGGEWVELPATVEEPILPPLPRRKGRWSAETRETWDAWRRDPATTQYTPADVGYALDTIRLVELAHAKPTAAMFEAIRVRMNGLGLTPKGKRDLRWRVAESAEVVELADRKPRKRPHLMEAR